MFVTPAEMQGLALPCPMLGHEPPFLILDWSPAHHCFIFIKHTCQFLVFSPSPPFFLSSFPNGYATKGDLRRTAAPFPCVPVSPCCCCHYQCLSQNCIPQHQGRKRHPWQLQPQIALGQVHEHLKWLHSAQDAPKCYFALPSWHKIEGSKDRIHFLKAFCPSYWLLIKSRVSITCLPSVLETNSTSQSDDGQNTMENKKLYFQFKGKLMLNIGPTAVFTQHS